MPNPRPTIALSSPKHRPKKNPTIAASHMPDHCSEPPDQRQAIARLCPTIARSSRGHRPIIAQSPPPPPPTTHCLTIASPLFHRGTRGSHRKTRVAQPVARKRPSPSPPPPRPRPLPPRGGRAAAVQHPPGAGGARGPASRARPAPAAAAAGPRAPGTRSGAPAPPDMRRGASGGLIASSLQLASRDGHSTIAMVVAIVIAMVIARIRVVVIVMVGGIAIAIAMAIERAYSPPLLPDSELRATIVASPFAAW